MNKWTKKECLQALFLTDPYEDMRSLKRKKGGRANGTCEWILGTDQLTAWLDDAAESISPPTDLLWLHGNPGTGKSTMSMFLVEALSEGFAKSRKKTLAYFFCDSGYDTRKTATGILRGLLLQLVQQHPQLIEHILPKYEERNARLFNSFDALWEIFLTVCADTATGRKHCIVDALDECEIEEQEKILKQIKETFGRDGSGGELNVRVLITSRPYPEIREYLQDFPNNDLAPFEESKRDIHKFIDEKVAKLGKMKKYTDDVVDDVTRLLRDRAGGIFLWVGLACQDLEKVPSSNALKRLEKIPVGLQSLYKQLLEQALQQDEDPETIKRLLSFVMVARRPLSMQELACACELYRDEDEERRIQFTSDAIESCRLMIVVQHEMVLLLHQSVRDFLVSTKGSSGFISEPEAHNFFAVRCVDYLISALPLIGRNERPMDEFISYSTHFWPEHAQMAEDSFRIEDGQAEFFAIDSTTRDIWWECYSARRLLEPSRLSIFHVAVRWAIPLLIDHALSLKLGHAGATISYIDSAYRDSEGMTPLAQCAASSHIHIFKILLDRADPKSHVDEAVIKAAAANGRSGAEVMQLLLDRKGDELTITEDILIAAATNGDSGTEVIELLLDRKGDEIVITEDIVKAAVENWDNGVKVMQLLLNWKEDEVTITEDIVKAAVKNWKNGAEVVQLLLDWKRDEITITDELVTAAAGNWNSGADVIKLLLDRKGDRVTITEAAVPALARYFGARMMQLLLDWKRDNVTITKEIVKAAVANGWNGAEVMKLLLDRKGDELTITEAAVTAVARYFGAEMMQLLLDRKEDELVITEEIVKAAAANGRSGTEVIELLLDRKGDEIVITEDIVKAAVENWDNGVKVMQLLLNWKEDEVTITEDIVKAAVKNWKNGAEVVQLLLDWKGDEVVITEEIIKAAAANWRSGAEVMQLLLDRKGDELTITGDILIAAATNGESGTEVIELLLDRKGDEVVVTENIMKAAVKTWNNGVKVLQLLLDWKEDELVITEEIVKAAAANGKSGSEMIQLLLDRKGDELVVTGDIVKAAVENWDNGVEVVQLLLDRRGDEVVVTGDIVKAAVKNWNNGAEVVQLLLDWKGDEVVITEDIVEAAAENWQSGAEVMQLILDRKGDELKIADAAVASVARNFGPEMLQCLLDRKGGDIVITENT